MKKDKSKSLRRAALRSRYYLRHEIKQVRRMTNRKFRRVCRRCSFVEEQETVHPSPKEYRTGGWITW